MWVLFYFAQGRISQVHACVIKVKFVSRATQKIPKFCKRASPMIIAFKVWHVHRSYTEGDREGHEVGRQQTEGHLKVVDEAICQLAVSCFLDEGAAVVAAEGHHAVTLHAQKHREAITTTIQQLNPSGFKATKQTRSMVLFAWVQVIRSLHTLIKPSVLVMWQADKPADNLAAS